MKTLIVAVALSSLAFATPLAPWEASAPPPAGTTFYQLQAKTSSAPSANNQYVQYPSNPSQYRYQLTKPGGENAGTPAKFFLRKYEATGTYAIHNSDDTRQIALAGDDSVLLYLTDATNPSAGNIPGGQLMEWATFTTEGNVLGVKDGSALTKRTFVAVRGTSDSWFVALYDGVSSSREMIYPITLNLVKVA
ncbi:hypothetical protein DPSP01_014295 [Paraphaeosphaeria sporulosa]